MSNPKRYGIILSTAPPGILLTESGCLVFKTEYAGEAGEPDLYVAMSGEKYCGDVRERCVDVSSLCEDAAREELEIP